MLSDEQLEAAVRALSDPDRFEGAERLVAAAAPQLQRILGQALHEGGWFGAAHESEVRSAAAEPDEAERVTRIETLLAEETRMGMLVGVAVGWQLASELEHQTTPKETENVDIRFLGHACFELSDGDRRVLVDPFLTGNPKAAAQADELDPTHVFLTHGHADHYGDIVDIAKRTSAQVVAITEVADELGEQGLENVADPNMGGTVEFDGGWVRVVPAWHTSSTPNGAVCTPAGLVINLGGKTIYHVGDTALFSDIRLPGERDQLDAAIVCIGGHYTMDRRDAAIAAEWIGAPVVIPCHYDTFPPIETDAAAFKADVEQRTGGKTTVEVLDPGGTLTL